MSVEGTITRSQYDVFSSYDPYAEQPAASDDVEQAAAPVASVGSTPGNRGRGSASDSLDRNDSGKGTGGDGTGKIKGASGPVKKRKLQEVAKKEGGVPNKKR